jgi:hypothetical protein
MWARTHATEVAIVALTDAVRQTSGLSGVAAAASVVGPRTFAGQLP